MFLYSWEYNFEIEHQHSQHTTLEIKYEGKLIENIYDAKARIIGSTFMSFGGTFFLFHGYFVKYTLLRLWLEFDYKALML